MKAADHISVVAPPKVFVLGPTCFTTKWNARPLKPIHVGLRRIPAEDRVRCDSEAIKRADALMPEERRVREDPMWQRIYEVVFIHYLIGFALCNPVDANEPLWQAQNGQTLINVGWLDKSNEVPGDDKRARFAEQCPVSSARFSEAGIVRILDEMDLLAQEDAVARRMASDEEMVALGEAFADGSFVARLNAANTDEARAVLAHLRMYGGAMLNLMERGREAPMPIIGKETEHRRG